jgi:hypothetical protein
MATKQQNDMNMNIRGVAGEGNRKMRLKIM